MIYYIGSNFFVYSELYLDTVIKFILSILSKEYRKLKLLGSHLDKCPPEDAEPASGIFYRLVLNNPPEKEDFTPNPNTLSQILDRGPEEKICQVYGVSVYKDIEGALKARKKFKSLKGTEPAIGKLTPKCGVIKNTPSLIHHSHHTWWPPCEMEIWSLFQIITQ